MNHSSQVAVKYRVHSRRSASRHLAGADSMSEIRNSPNGVGLPVTTVQKAAVASLTEIDWSDSERESEALVVRLASGDERALASLYDCTNRIVYGLALRILGDPSSAEDVTMEVYLQVWRTAESYDPRRGAVSSWLVTLARSRAIDCLRRRKARRAELDKPLFEDAARKYNTSLVRMEAGAHYPSHHHAAIEELFILSGDLHVENQIIGAGDYCRSDSGSIHGETFTDGGCLFLAMASQDNQIVENRAI
jgi:RNA polymerase sigma factor (sigma-70 family)